MSYVRRWSALGFAFASLALSGAASAQTVIHPRVLVMIDTSGSMSEHFTDNCSTGGDGSTFYSDALMTRSASANPGGLGLFEGFQLGAPTCPPPANAQYDGVNSRMYGAKAAFNNVLDASGDIDWGLMRYHGTQCAVVNTLSRARRPQSCTTDYDCAFIGVNIGTVVPASAFCIGGLCSIDNNFCYVTQDLGRTDAGGGACADTDPNPEPGTGNCGATSTNNYFWANSGSDCGTNSNAGAAGCATPQVCYQDADCNGGAAGQCALVGAGPVRTCQCGGAFAGCPTNYVCTAGRCVYNLGCQTAGGTIVVDPSTANSTTQIFPYIDGIEALPGNLAGIPVNPELRGVGPTPLAGAARTATDWYDNIKNNNLDPQILCRPYVLVQITDGYDECGAGNLANEDPTYGPPAAARGFVAATAPGAKNLNKVYVIGLAFGNVANPTLNSIAAAGGTGTARLANSQQDIEAALADIVSSSVLIEKCNHVDDDCDGVCDEPYPDVAQPDTCNVPLTDPHSDGKGGRNAVSCNNGALPNTHCYAAGSYVCSTDQLSEVCSAATCATNPALCPTKEVCNGIDDDCNGFVDDCTPFVAGSCCASQCPACNPVGKPIPETCNGCDDDCDGIVDNHLIDTGQTCGSNIGQCRPGTTYCCQEAVPTATMCSQSQATPQSSNPDRLVCLGGVNPQPLQCNGCDNNCDGVVDAPAQACYTGPSGTVNVGICRAGTQTCNAMTCPQAASYGACTGQVLPAPEVCNGVDDNCNGVVDDNVTDAWVGTACCPTGNLADCMNTGSGTRCKAGTYQCVAGARQCVGAIARSAEVCDGLDDDCNGIVDDVSGIGASCTGANVNTTGACQAAWACAATPGPGPNGLTCVQTVGPKPEVCNGIDDDCDGVVDEAAEVAMNDPGVGVACGTNCPGGLVANCIGACTPGTVVCQNGAKVCQGSAGPTPEVCNGIDDDCDGIVDDHLTDTWIGAACCPTGNPADCMNAGTGTRCMEGAFQCVAGMRTCAGGVARSPEVCNGVDDDCNGVVDDVIGIGKPCSGAGVTTLGPCTAAFACNGMKGPGPNGLTCTQVIGPQPEICNGVDDDCDGMIDDPADVAANDKRVGVVGGNPCVPLVPLPGTMFPQAGAAPPCNPGTTACKNGMIVCAGEVQPMPDVCNLPPTDCTGNPNNTGTCGSGLQCHMGACVTPCAMTEFPCPGGFVCDQLVMLCVPDQCLSTKCPMGNVCMTNPDGSATCVDPCAMVNCPTGFVCDRGICEDHTCHAIPCPAGQLCQGNPPTCVQDPCFGVTCPSGQFCDRTGKCTAPCANCPNGQICVAGSCAPDPCAHKECAPGEKCTVVQGMGMCVVNQCTGGCNPGTVCCGSMCIADPCAQASACPGDMVCALDDACNPTCKVVAHDRISGAGAGGLACSTGGREAGTDWASFAVIGIAVLIGRRRWLRRRALTGTLALAVTLTLTLTVAGCNPDPLCLDCKSADLGTAPGKADLFVVMPDIAQPVVPPDLATAPDLACVPTNGGVEICDHMDNDCNGIVDDVSPSKLMNDPNNCGACFHVCDFSAQHEFGACIPGPADGGGGAGDGGVAIAHCAPAGCQPGWIDLDNDPWGNGCEYQCTPTNGGVEICDGKDNDCNGVIDDGFGYPYYALDSNNCGGCGIACDLPGAVAKCVADPNTKMGVCVVDHCINDGTDTYRHQGYQPGVLNTTGCEYHCPSPSSTVTTGSMDCDNSPCTFPVEICNGIDDDCDFVVDDHLTDVNMVCGANCPGGKVANCIGQCSAGLTACTGGVLGCAGSVGPAAEVCNGKDDDCDGVIDDHLTDPWLNQACCPTGNLADCTNTATNGVAGTRCMSGTYQCSPGASASDMRVCVGGVAKSPETCNGVDDDCNGAIDDVAGLGSPCTGVNNVPDTLGTCTAKYACANMNGMVVTGPGPNGLTCTQAIGPAPEVCNGLDDDCDGIVDDHLTDVGAACADKCPGGLIANCVGQCQPGHIACSGGVKVCSGSVGPSPEVCDGIDNDCNGVIDDGFGYPNYNVDPNNCGACKSVCNLKNAIDGCHTDTSIDASGKGVCYVVACNNTTTTGYAYVPSTTSCSATSPPRDGPSGIGCNYTCPVWPKTAEVCDGKDNNCNGLVDEPASACAKDGLVTPTNFCANQGVCAGQTIPIACAGAAGWKCNYAGIVPADDLDANGYLTATEKECDGKDNNCNGVVDLDGFPTLGQSCVAGVGVCQNGGTIVCTSVTSAGCNATASPTRAVDELCNGKDDDCDGQVDERTPAAGSTCYNGGAHACKGWVDPMVQTNAVWVYSYEATRPDATATAAGANSLRACANAGVLPWATVTWNQAAAACASVKDSAGSPMRLCTAAEWQTACEGPGGAASAKWSMSITPATYVAQICNDANEATTPAVWATGSNGAQSVAKSEYCYTDWVAAGKLHDMSGNLGEWTSSPVVSNGTTYYQIRGGAFTAPSGGTSCEFDFDIAQPTFADYDIGFRCCADHAP